MKISSVGTIASVPGPAEWFTGRVRVDALFPAEGGRSSSGASVTFEPGARTRWHTHPAGQTLVILQGLGWVQRDGGAVEEVRPGDVVFFEPGEKHWHGASPNMGMVHLAFTEMVDGKGWEWLEPVSEAQYRR